MEFNMDLSALGLYNPIDRIPEDYKVVSIRPKQINAENKDEFYFDYPMTDDQFSCNILEYLSREYVEAAATLAAIALGSFRFPRWDKTCALLCRNAMELKLKQYLCKCNAFDEESHCHDLMKLWNKLLKALWTKFDMNGSIIDVSQLSEFILEVHSVDPSRDVFHRDDNLNYNSIAMIQNTIYLFEQLDGIRFPGEI